MAMSLEQLEQELMTLKGAYWKNNFTSHQDFNKSSAFNSRLKIPHYDSLPATCTQGEIIESGGKLYIGSAVNIWTLVGG